VSVIASGPDIEHLAASVGDGPTETGIEAMNHLGWTVISPSSHKISLMSRGNHSNQGATKQ